MSATGVEYGLKGVVKELLSYKAGIVGISLLALLLAISVYAIIAIPYEEAIRMWRGQEAMWIDNPRTAAPEWIEVFVGKRLPRTMRFDSRLQQAGVSKSVIEIPATDMKKVVITCRFRFDYDELPSEFNVFLFSNFTGSAPYVRVVLRKPSGEEVEVIRYVVRVPDDRIYVSISSAVLSNLLSQYTAKYPVNVSDRVTQLKLLFGRVTPASLESGEFEVEKGDYTITIEATLFSRSDDLDARVVIYGTVHGVAGTDHLRRPLEIALLWGTPIALAFGLTASLVTTFLQMLIAVISGWYGGWVDSAIQRVTELYMIIPFLPFLILISTFYKIDIWVLLAVIIVLSIFGAGIKSTRALVMQLKEYPYIEAARAYGASSFRIITLYIIPKILPPVVPGLIGAVPGYVFLEAALSLLGLGDPFLPTWGKVISDAADNGALYRGLYYWVLEPSLMLMLTAFAFASLGFALDKIVNPRLREL
ncbi:MAG: ABC transporter permease [Thermofilaceae archaeon]